MSDTKQRLTAALEALESKGWIKYSLVDEKGSMCIRGALGDTPDEYFAAPDECFPPITAALRDLGYTVSGTTYSEGSRFDIRAPAVRFNNSPATTFDDVRRVMQRAIELA